MVHISQLSSRYVQDPHDVVTVGQIVKVWVLEIDKARRRVALTMIQPGTQRNQQGGRQPAAGGERRGSAEPAAARPAESRPRPQRPRERQQQREPQTRTYTAKRVSKPAAPITKAMREGKEPLRTFGDLKQFFEKRESAGEQE